MIVPVYGFQLSKKNRFLVYSILVLRDKVYVDLALSHWFERIVPVVRHVRLLLFPILYVEFDLLFV